MGKLHRDRLVAHRGWPARYPENSLDGLTAALVAGARWLEFDLQFSADGVPLLVHDTTMERIGGSSINVLDSALEDLRRVPSGEPDRFGDAFADVRVATLADAVERIAGREDCCALVEMKPESIAALGTSRTLDRVLADLTPLRGRFTLISDHVEWLGRAADRGLPIGWIIREIDEATRQRCAALRPDLLICSQRRLDGRLPAWPGPWRWVIYTVNDPATAAHWFKAGAWLVETDAIGRLLDPTP